MNNKDHLYTHKVPSEIMPTREAKKLIITIDELDSYAADIWKKIDPKYYYQYKKGAVLCPAKISPEGNNIQMLEGFIKIMFQYIKDDIHDKEPNLEKRQEQLVSLSLVEQTIVQSVQLLNLFNFKLDVKSITSIIHGYINEYAKRTTNS